MYHFFPDGKEALGAETIRWSGAMYGQLIDLFYEPGADPAVSTRRFFEAAADTVRDTDYADACPIATVALEVASTSETLRPATAEVFESWLAAIDTRLVEAGLTRTGPGTCRCRCSRCSRARSSSPGRLATTPTSVPRAGRRPTWSGPPSTSDRPR